MSNGFKSGSITGTGAAITVSIGWIPEHVEVVNPNDAGSLWPTLKWWKGFADASGIKTLRTVDNGSTGNASSNKITTNGITPFAGDATRAPGFIIGADADINVAGEVIYYSAFRAADSAQR